MLLKKQTVWLLTMLSLVVVLSVYYITSPEQQKNELAAVEEKSSETTNEKVQSETATEEDEVIVKSEVASDEVFEALRLDLQDERSRMKEELTNMMASTELSAEERSKAKDQIDELNTIAQKEEVLETLIKAMDYEDVLVRADGEKVRITVKANEHSASVANTIIQTVRSEIGKNQSVVVEFQPSK